MNTPNTSEALSTRRYVMPAAAIVAAVVWVVLLATVGSPDIARWSVANVGEILYVTLVMASLYIIPGLAMLRWLWPTLTASWTEKFALACGIGVALPPLLLELMYVVGLPWSTPMTLVYVGGMILAVLLPRQRPWTLRPRLYRPHITLHDLTFVGLLGIALVVRLFLIRGLPVGMWGDSYHHTMIAQLLVDNDGIFSSWLPYAPLTTFTYHFGFHANVAFFHWLSAIPVPRSLLYTGQFLGAATLPLAYVLTHRLTGNRPAGLWAMVLTGFVNTQPIFYVNWGRYTQLAGQIILPALIICWIGVLVAPRLERRPLILAALLTASLVLTHYIVTMFAALFLGLYALWLVVRDPRPLILRQLLLRSAAIAFPALLLALPWLINTLSGYLPRIAGIFINNTAVATGVVERTAFQAVAPFYLTRGIIVLAMVGVLAALIRRNWRVVLLLMWSQLLVVLVVPQVVGLPGAGLIQWFTVYITLYLTVIPIAAYALGTLHVGVIGMFKRGGTAIAGAIIIVASTWGIHWQQSILEPANQLFSPADAAAMEWIRTNTSPDAFFLVNMFPAYSDSVVVGSDGGWWIALLTGRRTTLPPITYASEQTDPPDYAVQINDFAARLREHPLPSEEGLRLCREAGIDYVYMGTGQHTGQSDPFDPEALKGHAGFRVVYERDGITIVALQE